MSAKTDVRRKQLRADFLALSETCPFDHANPDDCPLHEVRKLKRPQRLKWLKALGEEDLTFLAAYHQVCLTTKVAPKLAGGRA